MKYITTKVFNNPLGKRNIFKIKVLTAVTKISGKFTPKRRKVRYRLRENELFASDRVFALVRKTENHHGWLVIQKRWEFLVGTGSCKAAAQSRYRFTLSSEMFARPAAPSVTKMSIIFGRVINQLARATSITGAH